MSGLTFQQHILNFAVLILIDFRMILNIVCCNLSLHNAGLLCITTDIIQFFPLKHNEEPWMYLRAIGGVDLGIKGGLR